MVDNINLIISEWVQSFRSDFLDGLFLFITQFGDETVFLILGAILYWTFDKKFAYRFIMFFLYGAVVNGGLKFLTNSPRPYVEFPQKISLIGEGSTGTSLPSGHAQNSTIMGLTLHEQSSKVARWFPLFLTIIVGLVMLSRIYLGEHYLTDVLFGFTVAFTFYTLVNHILSVNKFPKWIRYLPLFMVFPLAWLTDDKNVYLASASILGFTLGYPLEERVIGFKVQGLWWQQLLKLVVGLGVALALRVGIKAFFETGWYSAEFETQPLFTDHLLDFIRYFIIALWMTLGAPWLFKFAMHKKQSH